MNNYDYVAPISSMKVQKAADLAIVLGAKLATALTQAVTKGGKGTQKKPRHVTFYAAKPVYHLNDGDTLYFYQVNVVTGEITASHYAGSTDSAAHHTVEQFSEGQVPGPMVDAVLAVRTYWGGSQTFWEVDVISHNVNQLATQPAVAEKCWLKAA